jgi:hypothetical protein
MNKWWLIRGAKKLNSIRKIEELKFDMLTAQFDYPSVNSEFDRVSKKWPLEEFVIQVQDELTIEPLFGMGIHHFRSIEPHSVAFWGTLPSWKNYLFCLLKRKRKFDSCVVFDLNLGMNYFHFYHDILPKLFLIEAYHLEELPLLIHRRIFDTKHFQYYLQLDWVVKRNWVVIEQNEFISVQNTFFIKPLGYHLPYLTRIKALVGICPVKPYKRIFLNRSKRSGRYIINLDEIKPILDR